MKLTAGSCKRAAYIGRVKGPLFKGREETADGAKVGWTPNVPSGQLAKGTGDDRATG